jgi:hypothetical protein
MRSEPEISKEDFKTAFPGLFEKIREEAEADGFEKGKAVNKVGGDNQVSFKEQAVAIAEIERLKSLSPETLEEERETSRLKMSWDQSPNLQSYFSDFDSFKAYYRNRDRIKILGFSSPLDAVA